MFVLVCGFALGAIYYRDKLQWTIQVLGTRLVQAEKASSKFVKSLGIQQTQYPVYGLTIEPTVMRQIEVVADEAVREGVMTDRLKQWFPATFDYRGDSWKVHIRLKGDLANHWAHRKKSWRIRFSKDKLFQGRRVVDLIIPGDKSYQIHHLSHDLARELGLLVPDTGFARLTINSLDYGLYTWLEKYGPEMLEKQGYPQGEIVRHPNISFKTRFTGLGEVEGYTEYPSGYAMEIHDAAGVGHYVNRWDKLLKLVRNTEDEIFEREVAELVHLERHLTWHAITWLFGDQHSHSKDNLKWYYDNTSGLFEPMLYDVDLGPIRIPGTDPPQFTFDSAINNQLTRRIIQRPAFRHQRNEILWRLLKDAKYDLADRFESYAEQLRPVVDSGLGKRRRYSSFHEAALSVLSENRTVLLEQLAFCRVFVTPAIDSNNHIPFIRIGMLPDARGNVALEEIQIKLNKPVAEELVTSGVDLLLRDPDGDVTEIAKMTVKACSAHEIQLTLNDTVIWTPVDQQLRQVAAEWVVEVRFPRKAAEHLGARNPVANVEAMFRNQISGRLLDTDAIYRSPVQIFPNQTAQITGAVSLDEVIERSGLPLVRVDDRLKLPKGKYHLNKTVVLPAGVGLELAPGSVLVMGAGVSLVCYGPLTAMGNVDEPIQIIPASREVWGAFAVIRAGKVSNVRHLEVRGGSEAYCNGLYLSGQLCFYHSDVELRNCCIQSAGADDGLNVKKANVDIRNCLFLGNLADGFDADWVTGSVDGCVFMGNSGDGLDVSGAQLVVKNCLFNGSGDKSISAGERSQILVFNSVIRDSTIGLASKDQSKVDIVASVFYKNETAIALYRKKQIFGGAEARVMGSLLWRNEENVQTDAHSTMRISASAVDVWEEREAVIVSDLLRGKIENYYRTQEWQGAVHYAPGEGSPFLNPVSHKDSELYGFALPSLKGLPVGLSRPLEILPWITEVVEGPRESSR